MENGLEESARRLEAPGALRGGIEYFRAHRIDADHNREHGKLKLQMPVLTVVGRGSFEDRLLAKIAPLVANVQSVMTEDFGHYLVEEQPEQLARALSQFLCG